MTIRQYSEERKKHQSETLKKKYERGKIKVWNKGKTKETDSRIANHTEEFKKRQAKRMQENNPMFNLETRQKMIETKNEMIAKGQIKFRTGKRPKKVRENIRKGTKKGMNKPEVKAKLRESTKKQWARMRKKLKKAIKSGMNRPKVKERLRQTRLHQVIPLEDTSIEKSVQEELTRRGIKFEKVLIFCDGCYWHGCPIHYPNSRNGNRDRKITQRLTELGYTVLRFWGHEINEDVSKCVDSIEKEVKAICVYS